MQLARTGPQQSIKNKQTHKWKKTRKYVILTRIVSFVGTRCFTQSNAASDDVYAKGSLFLLCFFFLHTRTTRPKLGTSPSLFSANR